jgi:tetratricopeptide (TPR) repeat protein
MRELNTARATTSDEVAAPEAGPQPAAVFKQRLREIIEEVLASQASAVDESESSDAAAHLLEGNFYAARAAFERMQEQVPKDLFRTIGAACIANQLLTYGCSAYRVIGDTPPRRILLASGDASFNVNDLDRAQEAYLLAHSRRRLTRVADRLLATGHFYAARAIFERAGLRIPHKRFLRAAEQLRAAGDLRKANGVGTALGSYVNRD